MQPAQHIGQVDAQNVPRYVGLRTFARLPRLEDVEAADAAILGAPLDLGSTFRTGSRYGPPRSARPHSCSSLQRAARRLPLRRHAGRRRGRRAASPIDIAAAHATIERHARDP